MRESVLTGVAREPGTGALWKPWRRFLRRRTAVAGGIVVWIFLLATAMGPWIAPYSPTATDYAHTLAPPSLAHPAGTDDFGRDILSRLIVGSRYSLGMGLGATVVGATLGSAWGIASGFYGGTFDNISMRFVDILLAFPGILLAVAIVAVLGPGLLTGGYGSGIRGGGPRTGSEQSPHHGASSAPGSAPVHLGLRQPTRWHRDSHRVVPEFFGIGRAASHPRVGRHVGRRPIVPECGPPPCPRSRSGHISGRAGVQSLGRWRARCARPASPRLRALPVPLPQLGAARGIWPLSSAC